MDNSIFHIDLLKRYQLLTKPGTYIVSAAYTVTDKNYIADEYPRYLIPLRVVTGVGLEKILKVLDNGRKRVLFNQVCDCFLTGALWDNDEIEHDLPIKGEKLKATFDYVKGKLLCTHIELLPREELDFVDIDALNDFKNDILKLYNQNEIKNDKGV